MAIDAVLLVSFGGPESMDEVMPFLRRVTAGRGVPDDRLAAVAEHYYDVGGVSPINAQNRALMDALAQALVEAGMALPVYWGNRNSEPFLASTLRQMADDGIGHTLALVTAAYSSYSGCRQYRENLAAAAAEVGPDCPRIDKVRPYFDHPGFVSALADAAVEQLQTLPPDLDGDVRLLCSTHSIPTAAAGASGPNGGAYVAQHEAVCELVAEHVAQRWGPVTAEVVYQSRSGAPQIPWLEPDINDRLEQLPGEGVAAVVTLPIGFVSDHMEVIHDLDTEAAETAAEVGVEWRRAATPGVAPVFVAGLVELIAERVSGAEPRALSELGPAPDACAKGCCANPRGWQPVVAEAQE
jgi:ferrochelatase